MKKALRITLKILLGISLFIVCVIISLLVYYQSIYKKTPLPPDVSVASVLKVNPINSDKPILLPIPKKLQWTSGYFSLPPAISFTADPTQDAPAILGLISNRLESEKIGQGPSKFRFIKNNKLDTQAYVLSVQPNQIRIEYADLEGAFYALTTFKQLSRQSDNKIPCVQIEDKPDLKTRGAMLDISRGKVPTLKTLCSMIDFLADLKYNHVELYVEGFSFGYPSFKNLWQKTETPITPDEVKQLDAYCKARFIELVPNQNSLGHMSAWLATDEYKSLAECPDGYKFLGLINMKTTLAPTNPKSLELVTKMSDDLLPNFSSRQFNVDLDEPFELGKNKAHPINDPKEVNAVYLDYAKKLNTYVESKGKNMLMWGDVISRSPEIISQIPKNITLLEWRYESFQSFEKICEHYKAAGLHFMVCPGTSSWSSFTGRTDNMLQNVERAVQSGIKYGADGLLITDWGDSPHLQYLTVSFPGLAYAGALSWNDDQKTKEVLAPWLSEMAFHDQTHRMGDIVMALGKYNQFEEFEMVAGTMTGMAYRFGITDKLVPEAFFSKFQKAIFDLLPADEDGKKALADRFNNPKIYNAKAIIHYCDTLEAALLQARINSSDSGLVTDEYRNAIRMVKLGAELKQYNNYNQQQSAEENKKLLADMQLLCARILPEHKRLWMIRNKTAGYEQSTDYFKSLQVQIDSKLELLDKNPISRWISAAKDKVVTAVAVLYLK